MSFVGDEGMLARVANLYYKQDLTQQQVAQRLNVSRSLVSKMLREARRRGIVEVTVHDHGVVSFFELEGRLKAAFGLRDAFCFEPSADPAAARRVLGTAAAAYLPRYIENGCRVSVTSGETVYAAAQAFEVSGTLPDTTFIPVSGGLDDMKRNLQASHICAVLANRCGGHARQLHAPIVVSSEETKRLLMEEPFIRDPLAEARQADVALIGVGVGHGRSWMGEAYRDLFSDEVDSLVSSGAIVGDISFNFFDREGRTVPCAWNRQLVGLSVEQIVSAPTVVCVVGGVDKLTAIYVLLRQGMVNVLMTDAACAERLIAMHGLDAAPGA